MYPEMIPETAETLNNWIRSQFQVLESLGVWEEDYNQHSIKLYKRIITLRLELKGLEKDCCREIYNLFHTISINEKFETTAKFLFVRKPFTWIPKENILTGRLAFWNEILNEELLKSSHDRN